MYIFRYFPLCAIFCVVVGDRLVFTVLGYHFEVFTWVDKLGVTSAWTVSGTAAGFAAICRYSAVSVIEP